jgi:hypothetical protein
MPDLARSRWALLSVALFLAILCPRVSFSRDESYDKRASREWAKLVDRLFPQKPDDSLVAYRIVDEAWRTFPEYSFSLGMNGTQNGRTPAGEIVADVREANGGSIYLQIASLHRRNPSLGTDAILKLLVVSRFRLSEKDCPAIRTQFENFEQLRIVPLQFRGIILDASSIDFWITAGDGNMLISMNAQSNSQDYPLIAWANETRRRLDSCHARLIGGR